MSIFDIFRRKKTIPSPWEKYYEQRDLKYKIPNITMYDELKMARDNFKEKVAIEYFGKKISYNKFLKEVDKASTSFKTIGVKKGDIVTICMPNVPEVLYTLYALNKLGAIANMTHPLSASAEIKETLNETRSKVLVIMDMFYEKIENELEDTSVQKVIFVCASNSMNFFMKIGYWLTKKHKYKSFARKSMFMSYPKFIRKSIFKEPAIKAKNIGKNTPAVILHSGGSTGKPKHVVIQNRAFILVTHQGHIILRGLPKDSSCLAIMPNFHGFGLAISMHVQTMIGVKLIMVPQFDSSKFDVLLNKTKPTIVIGVPTLFEALIKSNNIKDLDLSSVIHVVSGGDSLSSSLEEKVNEFLKAHNSKSHIVQGYGMTECLAGICLALGDKSRSGSVGIPLPGNYIKIIDPSSRRTLPYGSVGEICINTRGLMMGYLNNEKETNESLQVHKDGYVWLHSGDLGCMDKDGYVYYKGRIKRMIVTSGYNVYPSHIEQVIESHKAVLQCSVVGIPHPYKQEVPKAFIVLKEGYHGIFLKAEIKEYCKKNLAKYMVPYKFVYRKSLPKTKLGKVDFRKLQEDNEEDEIL